MGEKRKELHSAKLDLIGFIKEVIIGLPKKKCRHYKPLNCTFNLTKLLNTSENSKKIVQFIDSIFGEHLFHQEEGEP